MFLFVLPDIRVEQTKGPEAEILLESGVFGLLHFEHRKQNTEPKTRLPGSS